MARTIKKRASTGVWGRELVKSTAHRSHMFQCKINLFVCLLWLSFTTFRSIIWSINYVNDNGQRTLHTQQCTAPHTAPSFTLSFLRTNKRNRYLMKWQKRCNRKLFTNVCQHLLYSFVAFSCLRWGFPPLSSICSTFVNANTWFTRARAHTHKLMLQPPHPFSIFVGVSI